MKLSPLKTHSCVAENYRERAHSSLGQMEIVVAARLHSNCDHTSRYDQLRPGPVRAIPCGARLLKTEYGVRITIRPFVNCSETLSPNALIAGSAIPASPAAGSKTDSRS